jgi:hypothetical protein
MEGGSMIANQSLQQLADETFVTARSRKRIDSGTGHRLRKAQVAGTTAAFRSADND